MGSQRAPAEIRLQTGAGNHQRGTASLPAFAQSQPIVFTVGSDATAQQQQPAWAGRNGPGTLLSPVAAGECGVPTWAAAGPLEASQAGDHTGL